MYFSDVLLCLAARDHDLMAAAGTAEFEVHSDSFNLPFITAARVRLLHFHNVAETNIHLSTSDRLPLSLRADAFFLSYEKRVTIASGDFRGEVGIFHKKVPFV